MLRRGEDGATKEEKDCGAAEAAKSSQELLPVGYKAPYLSRRCAFASRTSLHGRCEALVSEALWAAWDE
jgi:hypothetical protein